MDRGFASLAIALLLATATAQTAEHQQLLARHRASFGGEAALASGDLLLAGTLEGNGPQRPLRIWIRRQPFGYREESGAGASTTVFLSDGEYAWTIRGGEAQLARGPAAVSLLEFAFLARFGHLEPGRIDAWNTQPITMWEVPGSPAIPGGQACRSARVRTTTGTLYAFHFDADDGRLHGIVQEGAPRTRWTRFGGWQTFGPFTLPTVRADGVQGMPFVEWQRFERVETGLAHDPKLFPPPPLPAVHGEPRVAAVDVVPTCVPGAAVLHVPALGLNGAPARLPAVLDTGISELGVEAKLAARLGIHSGGGERVTTPAGEVVMGAAFLDSVDLDGHRLVQVVARTASFPMVMELTPAAQPAVHLGGPRLLAAAPVLDLERGELRIRRTPGVRSAAPLAAVEAPAIVIPIRGVDRAGAVHTVEVSVGGGVARVMLDTGSAQVLRLSPSTLKRLGLPRERDHWLRAGGLPVATGSVGGAVAADLLVQLDAVNLGPIVYEKPWVVVGFTGSADDEGDFGLLGAGALLPFALAAIDVERAQLDLVPRAGSSRSPDGRLHVPPPGLWLGCGLLAPGWDTVVGKTDLPCVALLVPGGIAERAGLRARDLVEALDGEPVRGQPMATICRRLWLQPGATIAVRVRRQGEAGPITIVMP